MLALIKLIKTKVNQIIFLSFFFVTDFFFFKILNFFDYQKNGALLIQILKLLSKIENKKK